MLRFWISRAIAELVKITASDACVREFSAVERAALARALRALHAFESRDLTKPTAWKSGHPVCPFCGRTSTQARGDKLGVTRGAHHVSGPMHCTTCGGNFTLVPAPQEAACTS